MATNTLERQDITLEPKYPFLIFGDGYIAQIISIMPAKNVLNQDVWKVRLLPSQELIKKHNITMDILDEALTINVEYPLDSINQLSADPVFTVYFCFMNFKGEDSPATRFWKGNIESERLEGLRAIIRLLKAENAYLMERLEKAKTNIREYIKDEIMGPANEISSQYLNSLQSNAGGAAPTVRNI